MKKWRIFSILMMILFLLVTGTGTVFAQDEPPEEDPEGAGQGQNPVAFYLSDILEVEYEEVITLQKEDGYGLGNISKAFYILSLATEGMLEGFEGDINFVLEQAKEMGWGNYYKSLDMHPGGGHGLGWMFKEYGKKEKTHHGKPDWAGGPPDHANNNKDKDKNKD